MLNENIMESLVMGHQSIWIGFFANKEAQAATPKVLNIMLPTIALSLVLLNYMVLKTDFKTIKLTHPISESATNVEIVFAKNSGMVVAVAINVDALKNPNW